jgi:hypothetical protein
MNTTYVTGRAHFDSIDFTVDFSTGEVGGPDGSYVSSWIQKSMGKVTFPWLHSYPAPDPARNPESMALMLMSLGFYDLDGELSKFGLPRSVRQ